MKNNNQELKPSPMEVLRQRKDVLKQECHQEEGRFFEMVDAVRSNWKGLLVESILSSPKSLARSLFSSSKKTEKQEDAVCGDGLLLKVVPIAWTVLQPILMKAVMNRIQDMFVRKKKK